MLSPDLIFSTSVNPHGLQKRATGPFRAPHYSVSGLALVGELELASAPGGVLYLQEFLEFSRSAVECLYGALSERLTKGQDVPQCIVCDVRLSLPVGVMGSDMSAQHKREKERIACLAGFLLRAVAVQPFASFPVSVAEGGE